MKYLLRPFLWAALAGAWLHSAAVAQSVPTPSPGLMPNVAQGKRLYEKNCATCHGPSLQGTEQGPPFLNRIYEPGHHGDASFQMAARYGTRAHHWRFGDMKPVPGVSPDDVVHITAYVRQQQRLVGIY